MVELKNIVEDMVFDLVDGLDEVRSGEINKNQKQEIAAYALNRIKPMYITSNKGFTNLMVKYQNDPQFLADMMVHISEALKVVKKSTAPDVRTAVLDESKLHYVFPKLYGKIISSRDMLPLSEGRVALKIDDGLSQSRYDLWKNPAEITPRDEGIFSFAPQPIEAQPPFQKRSFIFSITVSVSGKEYDYRFQVESVPVLLTSLEADVHENVMQLEDIYFPF